MNLVVVAVDPGSTTGIAILQYKGGYLEKHNILQAEGSSAASTLEYMLAGVHASDAESRRLGVIELFVTARGTANTKDANITRELVPVIDMYLKVFEYTVYRQKAADVKLWATDKRLKAVFPSATSSINGKARDGWDAARHAMYVATKHGGVPDPLR